MWPFGPSLVPPRNEIKSVNLTPHKKLKRTELNRIVSYFHFLNDEITFELEAIE